MFAGVSSVELGPTNYSHILDSIKREQEKKIEQRKRREQIVQEEEERVSMFLQHIEEERSELQ